MCIIYIYHIYIHVPYIFIYISTSAYIYSSLNNRSIVPFVPSRCRLTKHEPKETLPKLCVSSLRKLACTSSCMSNREFQKEYNILLDKT